jgi:protein arginine N-methyltransferase 1
MQLDFTPNDSLKYFDNPKAWVTKDSHRYKARELWYPLAHAVTNWEDEFHQLMLRDSLRMDRFRRATFQVMHHLVRRWSEQEAQSRGSAGATIRVLDLGTGYGILSYWAAEAFRSAVEQFDVSERLTLRVYAIEGNSCTSQEAYRRLAREGLAYRGPRSEETSPTRRSVLVCSTTSYEIDSYLLRNHEVVNQFDPGLVQFVEGGPTSVHLGVDLVLAEIFGSIVDTEDAVAILANAISRYLLPGGHVVPESAATVLVPIGSDPEDRLRTQLLSKSEPKRISRQYKTLPDNQYNFCYDVIIPLEDHLSDTQEVISWKFGSETSCKSSWDIIYSKDLEFVARKAGSLVGLKGFFRMVLTSIGGETVTLDIGGDDILGGCTSDCWKHLFLPVTRPMLVSPGDTISVTFERIAKHLEVDVVYRWRVESRTKPDISNVQEYCTLRPFLPPMEGHFDQALQGLCHYVESSVEGTLLPGSDEEAAQMICSALTHLLKNSDHQTPFFPSFYLAWPSSKDEKRRRYVWFSVECSDTDYTVTPLRCEALDTLPAKGVIYRYQVDPNDADGEFVSLSSMTYTSLVEELTKQDSLQQRILQSDEFLDRHPNYIQKGIKPGFLSLVVIPQEAAFRADAVRVQNMRAFIYLLQGRLLVQLLLDYYKQRGMADTGYAVAHEIGQVTQFLHVAAPTARRSGLVWAWSHAEELLRRGGVPESSLDDCRSVLSADSVVSLFPRSYQAAVSYIDLVADSKSAITPFNDWHRKPLREALESAKAFAVQSAFAHWLRTSTLLQTDFVTQEVLEQLQSLETEFFEGISAPDNVRVFFPAEVEFLHLPSSDENDLESI